MSSVANKPLNDPVSMAKPYLSGPMDYFSLYKVQTWEDGDPSGDAALAEYSEFQKPYDYDEDEPEDYPWWEWTWPDTEYPGDPIDSPCSAKEGCTWAKVFGPTNVTCDNTYPYTQFHVWLGCETPWYAAFGSWELITTEPDYISLESQNPIFAMVKVEEDTPEGSSYIIRYIGPLGCQDELKAVVSDCCCTEFEIDGDDTVDPGSIWVGQTNPPCDIASCDVSSNSGCELECSIGGSTVSVQPGALDCGSFTVSATGPCGETASKTVRINDTGQGGSWVSCAGSAGSSCPSMNCGSVTCAVNGIISGSHQMCCSCWGYSCSARNPYTLECSDDGYQYTFYRLLWCCNGCQDCGKDNPQHVCAIFIWKCSC